jgi:GNAT superfamily N-acetyltransferase
MTVDLSNQMEAIMTYESRCLAGVLLVVLPTVMFGGVSILSLLIGDPTYMQNALRQDLWRAGHAHAGVWLILALVALRYVDEANLSDVMKWLVRASIPTAAILVPAAFFCRCRPMPVSPKGRGLGLGMALIDAIIGEAVDRIAAANGHSRAAPESRAPHGVGMAMMVHTNDKSTSRSQGSPCSTREDYRACASRRARSVRADTKFLPNA